MKQFIFFSMVFCMTISTQTVSPSIESTTGFLDLSYCTIWYTLLQAPDTKDNPPLIVIHGGPGLGCKYLIEPLTPLAVRHPVILYDQSGCDNSPLKEGATVEWTFEHYCEELKQVIAKLCPKKKVILFGYSWGAALATWYAATYPEKVIKLILASPYLSTARLENDYKKLTESLGIYKRMHAHEIAGTTNSPDYQNDSTIFFKEFIFRGNPLKLGKITRNDQIIETMWGQNELTVTGNLKNLDVMPLLEKLNMPVLLTSGRFDTMTQEFMLEVRTKIKDCAWQLFKDSAHLAYLEEQDKYTQCLKEFLNK